MALLLLHCVHCMPRGHQALLRVIYVYLVRFGRRKGVDRICDGLKALQKEGFNLTLTYFWLQVRVGQLHVGLKSQLQWYRLCKRQCVHLEVCDSCACLCVCNRW